MTFCPLNVIPVVVVIYALVISQNLHGLPEVICRYFMLLSAPDKGNTMLKVIAEDFMQPDAVEILMPMYEELVAATRREPLCISYDLFVDQKDPGHFVFIETWPDQAALDAHCASEHFRRLVPAINKYQRAEPRFILMDSAVK